MTYGKSRTPSQILLILLILSGMVFAGCNTKTNSQLEREKRMHNSPHFKEGKFVNPIEAPMMAKGSTWKYIKKAYLSKRIDPEPSVELPVIPIKENDWIKTAKDNVRFAWLGHSSILINSEGKNILVDPVVEKRASPFSWIGPKRFHPPPVTAKDLPPIAVVLITHDHYDHLEKPTMIALKNKADLFLVPLGIGELLEAWGVAPEKVKELDWWERHGVGSLTFTATPGVHYARRGLIDGDKRLWCSWSIAAQSRKLFVSGDSGYFDGFREVGDKLGPFDVTFLKIGSSDEMWKQIHMTPEGAVQQHQDLKGSIMVPLHWATFDLALHPWYEPIERTLAAVDKTGDRVITPLIGEQIDLEHLPEVNEWWRTVDNQ